MTAETKIVAKIRNRIVPLLVLCSFMAFLDRVNLSFAAASFSKDIGLTATAFGFGAGLFFIGYVAAEVPSNIFMLKFGARRWIARIMLTWGILSASTAFVTGPTSFYIVRVLLGIAEAGFFPAVFYYLTLWFPIEYRGRILGLFVASIPLSTVLGAPLSGLILSVGDVGGWAAWQVLFIVEAIPSVILAIVVFFLLPDTPEHSKWLSAAEKSWLKGRLASEKKDNHPHGGNTVLSLFGNGYIWALSFTFVGILLTNYGLSFFLPQIIAEFGFSKVASGFITAIPYLVGAISMILWGRRSDRVGERIFHVAIPLLVAATGISLSAFTADPVIKMLILGISGFGIFGAVPVFWTLPSRFLDEKVLAPGLALVNSLGSLAGFGGPFMMGYLKDKTGTYTAGLLTIGVIAVLAAITIVLLGRKKSLNLQVSSA